jgi:hypothetical protein
VAATTRGARLTKRHREQQLSIRAAFLRELLRLFGLLDPRRLDRTVDPWLSATMPLVQRHWQRSATASATYLALYREAETGRAGREPTLPAFTAAKARAVTTSLLVTGPVEIKSLVRTGTPLSAAVKTAQVTVAGSAGRHVLDGGRAVLLDPTSAGLENVRYARVTDGDACWFCAMMASRGYVYLSGQAGGRNPNDRFTGTGLFKFHDHCGCTLEPGLVDDAPLPENNARYVNLWATATRGLGGTTARRAFRRAVEGRPLPEDPISRAS